MALMTGMLLLLVAALTIAETEPRADAVLAALDLSSFRNSVGPRHLQSPATPETAGFTEAAFEDGHASRTSTNGDWSIGLRILAVEGDDVRVCFTDMASKASYFVQTSLTLHRSGNVYVAMRGTESDNCPEWRSRSDAAPPHS